MPVCVVFLLTGCGNWNNSAKPSLTEAFVLPELPATAHACERPAALSYTAQQGYVSPDDLLKGWARDRKRLSVCKAVNESLLSYIETLRTSLNR